MVARAYSPSVQKAETKDHQSKIKFGGTLSQLTDSRKKENKTNKPEKYKRERLILLCVFCLLIYKLIMIKEKSSNTVVIV